MEKRYCDICDKRLSMKAATIAPPQPKWAGFRITIEYQAPYPTPETYDVCYECLDSETLKKIIEKRRHDLDCCQLAASDVVSDEKSG